MESDRFDALARSLTAAGSRRRAVIAALGGTVGLLGIASLEPGAAKKKKPCPPCKKRKKGKCKRKKPDGTACPGGICQSGRCGAPCPPVCPVCQTCNSTTGLCGIQASQNGFIGNGCGAPHVCCNGVCCDPIHQCNAAGTCATCTEVCPNAGCNSCFHTTEGGTICTASAVISCPTACTSSATCGGGNAACMTSFTAKVGNTTQQIRDICAASGAPAAVCTTFTPC